MLLHASFAITFIFVVLLPEASVNSAFFVVNFIYRYVLLINFQSCNVSEIYIC